MGGSGFRRGKLFVLALAAALPLSLIGLVHGAAAHEAADRKPTAVAPDDAPGEDLARLDPDWWRGDDLIVTGRGDVGGYHLLIGLERQKYVLRPLTTIQPNGYSADDWLGYQCVTGDRRHVVVTLAPRWAVNRAELRDRGGLAYVVDLPSGAVRPALRGVAFKYHATGCGPGSHVALLRHLGRDQAQTELLSLDARTLKATLVATVPGQLTSPVPSGTKLLALQGRHLVQVSKAAAGVRGAAAVRRVATVAGEPYRLTAAANGEADLLVLGRDGTVELQRLAAGGLRRVGSGRAGEVWLYPGAGGQNIALGLASADRGRLAVRTAVAPEVPGRRPGRPSRAMVQAVSVEGRVVLAASARASGGVRSSTSVGAEHDPASGARLLFSAGDGRRLRNQPGEVATLPAVRSVPTQIGGTASPVRVAADPLAPVCGVLRNNPRRQAYGAVNAQADWAVQQGSRNLLKGTFGRPANHLASGLPAYSPSSDFEVPRLLPAGGNVPPAVMNGVLAQESAYRHASRRSLPGSGGNSVISDYYGARGTVDVIDYTKADCGYGIAQVTTGMRLDDRSISANGKAKVAIDYAENIQAGLNILAKKWNQLFQSNIILYDSNPAYVENWYLALWAYNSGVQPGPRFGNTSGCTPSPTCTDEHGHWGLGWTNNPMSPDYPPDRDVFLRNTYADAEHPGDWPYQERVLGWAETPIRTYKGDPAYRPAVANAGRPAGRPITYPQRTLFCNASNDCDVNHNPPGTDLDYCKLENNRCWWHNPTPGSCASSCATSPFTYGADAREPDGTNPWPAACNSELGSRAVIVDELNDPSANLFCPNRNWSTRGTFAYTVGRNAAGAPLGEIDFHQLTTGFGGHTWFAGNRLASDPAHQINGVWTPTQLAPGPYVIKVHVPRAGASVGSAVYKITTADGSVRERMLNQHEHFNHWKTLGVYQLGANAKVTLSNVIAQDDRPNIGTVAWDAVAFVPAPGRYVEHEIDAVALFDENQNLDASNEASWLKTPFGGRQDIYDWGMRVTSDTLRYPACTSGPASNCVMPRTRTAMQRWQDQVRTAGSDPVNHPPGVSQATWTGFGNTYRHRPTGPRKPAYFDNDDSAYKIRSKVRISFVIGDDGRIVDGSADADYDHRTADTHLPRFVMETMGALQDDYGIAPPDLTYSTVDLNVYNHRTTTRRPNSDEILPGRAFKPGGKAPVVTNYESNPVSTAGTCVAGLFVSGGMIGYRPMLGVGHVSSEVEAWERRTRATRGVPEQVGNIAGEIYNAFFKTGPGGGVTGSIFNQAPPIWQELNLLACVDGSIRKIGRNWPLFRASHMPNQYLYQNGRAINLDGGDRSTAEPVLTGEFVDFSKLPEQNQEFPLWPNGYGPCDTATGRSGNPWDLTSAPPKAPGVIPGKVHFCLDKDLAIDEEYSE